MTEQELTPVQFGNAFKAFMEAVLANATPPGPLLSTRLRDHLQTDPSHLPVSSEEFDPYEHPNLQVAIDDYIAQSGRSAEVVGVASQQRHFMGFGLSILVSEGRVPGIGGFLEGPVDSVNFHLAGDQVLPCVQFGIYLISDGEDRIVAAVIGADEQHGKQKVQVEAMATRPEAATSFLQAIREGMLRLNVYRGNIISLSPGRLHMGPQTLVTFHALPEVARDDLVLPDRVLERIERHTFLFTERAAQLLAAGQSLKRGMLLHGPPGTGKTLTLMYLIGRMPGRTVILTTGLGIGLLQQVMQIARTLAPAMVVLEDIDLIAEERGHPFHQSHPLLFELLNELDGLQDDCDVIFALTTNRPEFLEPALAARPGRVDLAVEIPLPDAVGRRRLIELYARGLALRDVDVNRVVAETDGASPAYIKELLRRAAVISATNEYAAAIEVTGTHLDAALAEMSEGGAFGQRILGRDTGEGQPGMPGRMHGHFPGRPPFRP